MLMEGKPHLQLVEHLCNTDCEGAVHLCINAELVVSLGEAHTICDSLTVRQERRAGVQQAMLHHRARRRLVVTRFPQQRRGALLRCVLARVLAG